MRWKEKRKIANRICAAILTIVMVLGLIPTSTLSVLAATEKHPDAVTITVKDEEGKVLSDVSVNYTIDSVINGADYKTGILKTDEYGTVEVLSSTDYAENDLTISANVSKDGYAADTSLTNTLIDAADKDFEVKITSTRINGVTVTPAKESYAEDSKGKATEYNAVTVEGTKKGDTVTYEMNGKDYGTEIPKISAVGTYSVKVKVQRTGFEDYTETVTAEVAKGKLDISVDALERAYQEGVVSDAVMITGGKKENDTVTYRLNDGVETSTPPQITNAGTYKVTVKVHRDDNYEDFVKEYTARINTIDIEGLSAILYKGTYDGKEHDAVLKVNGTKAGDVIEYKKDSDPWSETIPKVKDAGEYTIEIRVKRDANHNLTSVIGLTPATVVVEKKEQSVSFNKFSAEELFTYDTQDAKKNEYDFSVQAAEVASPTITYSIENNSGDSAVDDSDIATIDSSGNLIVNAPGSIYVVATVSGDANYKETTIKSAVDIKTNEKELVYFKNRTVSYVLGTSMTVSNQRASKRYGKDGGELTYSASVIGSDCSVDAIGLSINSKSGSLSVSNMAVLADYMAQNGNFVSVQVKVDKAPYGRRLGNTIYPADSATYEVSLSFETTPETTHTLQDPAGNELTAPNGSDGWFNTAVTVIPAEGYSVTQELTQDFADSVEFDNQGIATRKIYLKNISTKGITAPIIIDVEKIDSVKPDSSRISVDYSEPVLKSVLSKILWFYEAPVTVTFTAYDNMSGVHHFTWNYTKSIDASASNLETDKGVVAAIQDNDDKNKTKFTGSVTLPKDEAEQLRGYITVNATDKAGLTSEDKRDDGRVIVVDTISPEQNVSFQLKEAGGTSQKIDEDEHYYFSDDVEFTFQIKEANFFAEDVMVKVAKDGGEAQKVNVTWSDTANLDEHETKYTLSGDGDYVVTMEYTDRSGHKMPSYTSEVVTIDTTAPVIGFKYSNDNNTSAAADNSQTATVTITEHNFNPGDIEVGAVVKDIQGSDIAAKDLQEILRNAVWDQNGDVYSTIISEDFVDGIYNLTFNYKDLALNPAAEVNTGEFIVDHTAPDTSSMKVSYSTPIMEKLISAVTFGYYNPNVTVTFEAADPVSGVEYFTWSYMKESGASDVNVESYPDAKITAVQDITDKSKFTATITLPNETAEQLRGNIAFTATDKYKNTSNKLTDTNHTIVVDTVAPTMTADYTEAARTVGNKMYYNKDMTATFTVTEANFYPEDVVVEVSKNGETYTKVTPTWQDTSTDVHLGTYTISAPEDHSGDADYMFRIQYKDRSNNEMAVYTSNTITIDTIKPEIEVTYAGSAANNVLSDGEGHTRQYFDATRTATVEITEHNFESSEVGFAITAKDAAGNELDIDSLNTKSAWKTSGDKHSITITYPGDANYTFDVAYTDLAQNKADDYATDYFTVDKTAPVNLKVSYSTSILDTVIQGITFGFYNAPVTVTISADDEISSVHQFKYNYKPAPGVSPVNAGLINQAIEEKGITYSNNRRTATTKFTIPKDALGGNNQFNGNVSFITMDRSGNDSSELNDKKRIVVDNITPTSSVAYNTPVQISGGVAYYDGAINVTITIHEANFYSEDVQISVTKDGVAYPVSPNWSNSSTDEHVGTFSLTDDGDYFVTVNYADKSSNRMATYTSEQMTVDTEIKEPVITVNGEEANGKAFKGDVIPAVSFEDINFESYEIKLLRTRYNDKNVDVTERFIGKHVSVNDQGGTGEFDTFVKEPDVDGIYTLTVSMTDKAGHSSETSSTFTVNRFGSVYEYGEYLSSLIKDGGAYVQEVKNDLVITEYNADRLLSGSLNIEISRDGKPLQNVDYKVTPQINDKVAVGNSGWYQYEYTISKENFDTDGIYKMAVSSKDATGNSPETTNYEDKNILFRVDSTAPEIESITGLEESIINAQNVTAKYSVYDTIGLASVKVYVDGEVVDTVTDFTKDANSYSGDFTVSEKNSEQKVRLVVEDLAGNVTDTDADEFESAYAFNKSVTVSTNFFVRFFANKLLFWGTVVGVAAVLTFIILLLAKRRKKEDETVEK